MLENFDKVNGVKKPSGAHATPTFSRDRDDIVKHLLACNVFTCHSGRKHATFPKPRDVLHSLKSKELIDWMISHIK